MFWMTQDQVHQKREDPNTNPLSQIQNYWLYPNLQSECILESLFFFPFIELTDDQNLQTLDTPVILTTSLKMSSFLVFPAEHVRPKE